MSNPKDMPPHNIEVEERLLACMLRENDTIDEIGSMIEPSFFFRDANQILFSEMLGLYEKGERFDGVVLGDRLHSAGKLDRIGGREFLSHLLEGVLFHSVEAEYYAQILRNHALLRELTTISADGVRAGYSQLESAEELAARLESRISDALTRHSRPKDVPVGEAARDVFETIRKTKEGEVTGLETGLTQLDDVLGAMEPGRLIVIAGRPGMGKSCLGLNILDHLARAYQIPSYIFSLEMMASELTKRLISSATRIEGDKLKGKIQMTRDELARVERAAKDLEAVPIRVDDGSSKTPIQILSQAKLAKRKHGVGIVLVDHVGLVNPVPGSKHETRQQQIGKTTRMLKNLAKDLNVPVIVLSQINRSNTDRPDKRPTISDLRESGDIEQDADSVILIHRRDYYDGADHPGQAELIVGKNRDGGTGTAHVAFNGAISRFDNLYRYEEYIPPETQE